MNEGRSEALRRVTQYAFAMIDAQLYLDAYPDDAEALAYYREMDKKHTEALAEYESTYGPLTASGSANAEPWRWSEGPWPWQIKEECNVCGRM